MSEIRIDGERLEEEARQNATDPSRKVISSSSTGKQTPGEVVTSRRPGGSHHVRRGAMWGACAGFLLGLVPLVGSILIGAVAGGAYCQGVRTEDRERFGTAPPVRQPVSHLKRSVDA
jgi:hypothetical protein